MVRDRAAVVRVTIEKILSSTAPASVRWNEVQNLIREEIKVAQAEAVADRDRGLDDDAC
jgi:hypothetical protein